MRRRRTTCRGAVIGFAVMCVLAGCSPGVRAGAGTEASDGTIAVVAAENVWDSIAKQLGGSHAEVTSIITSPETDPHTYEPTTQDARAIASSQYVIFNGLGYDTWAGKAIDANPAGHRGVLEVGKLLGLQEGDNPHRWYFPDDVDKVINQITADFKKLDPPDAAYFDQQRQNYETAGLKQYKDLLAQIRQQYQGTPVGASESIVVGMAEATGLDLKTPSSFLTAISEGTDPTAQDKATVDQEIAHREIRVFVYNSQNSTPDVAALVSQAQAAGIPDVTVTETLAPANASFQDWQTGQLAQLADALAKATGK